MFIIFIFIFYPITNFLARLISKEDQSIIALSPLQAINKYLSWNYGLKGLYLRWIIRNIRMFLIQFHQLIISLIGSIKFLSYLFGSFHCLIPLFILSYFECYCCWSFLLRYAGIPLALIFIFNLAWLLQTYLIFFQCLFILLLLFHWLWNQRQFLIL